MKKILVILLVLAVTAGVFAQGDWSVGAEGEITAFVDFSNSPAEGAGMGYHRAYDNYGWIYGKVGIGYVNGIFSGGVDLHQQDGISGHGVINGDKYFFEAESSLEGFSSANISRLWGKYYLVNDMVKLEVAYDSSDPTYWVSDDTAGSGFADFDHNNYILGELTVGGLQAGLVIPNLFYNPFEANYSGAIDPAGDFSGVWVDMGQDWMDGVSGAPLLGDDMLKQLIFGAKFDMSPIEVAAQFTMVDYGVYFGGKFFAGPITVGLSFMGVFPSPAREIKAGLSVAFDGGSFGAGVKAYLYNLNDGAGVSGTEIGLEPNFWIKAIPSYFYFGIDGGFYFTTVNDNGNKSPLTVDWMMQPQLFWNFTGGGAPDGYYSFGTGFIVRYRVSSFKKTTAVFDAPVDSKGDNNLTIAFKFNMW